MRNSVTSEDQILANKCVSGWNTLHGQPTVTGVCGLLKPEVVMEPEPLEFPAIFVRPNNRF
jgi:hypothetical protein